MAISTPKKFGMGAVALLGSAVLATGAAAGAYAQVFKTGQNTFS